MEIKVIQTEYKGYLFRSRLEARWAVFFDEIGLTWEYEKEGYELPSGWYLPDFWIHEWDSFAEIKGACEQLEDGLKKCLELESMIDKRCFVLYGVPDHELYQLIFSKEGIENPNKILQCRRCDGFWFAEIESISYGVLGGCKLGCNSEKHPYLSDRLLNAHNKAKSYRF